MGKRDQILGVATATLATLALLLVALLVPAGASAKVKTFRPVDKTRKALVFAPRNVNPEAVRAAKLKLRNRRTGRSRDRRVAVVMVRRAAEQGSRLKIRRARRTQGKLRVKLAPAAAPVGHCEWGSFAASAPPKACWRPYGNSSPFNVGVGEAPQSVSNSNAIVDRTLAFGAAGDRGGPVFSGGIAATDSDYDHPIYYSQPGDPAYTVRCRKWVSSCELDGVQVRIPAGAKPAGGGDGHLSVIDQEAGWEYDMWEADKPPRGGGNLYIGHGGMTRIGTPDADGLGSSATAAHFGLAAGVIRPEELAEGEIRHALFMSVKCTNGTYVWPAQGPGVGRTCSSMGRSNANAPALGQHYYLDLSVGQINSLAIPEWKKAVLRAMAEYGMFVGDTGSDYLGWGIVVQSGSSYTSFGMADPWTRLGHRYGIDPSDGRYYFDMKSGFDWQSKLRVAHPCVSQQAC